MSEMQFVIFKLGKDRYSVDLSYVSNITKYKEINPVPDTPLYIDGVINLRGSIIPIINLKKKFGIEICGKVKDARILIVNIIDKDIGFVVDEVSQITSVSDKFIDKAPDVIKGKGRESITGIAKVDNEIVIILDLKKVLLNDEK